MTIVNAGLTKSTNQSNRSLVTLIPNKLDTGINRGTGPNTYTRLSKAYVPDFEGRIVTVYDNSPSFPGLRSASNLLTYSEDFSNAVWALNVVSLTHGITDPNGGTTATTVTATGGNAYLLQQPAIGVQKAKRSAIWVRRRTGTGNIDIIYADGSGWYGINPTATWQRFSHYTAPSTGVPVSVGVRIQTSGDAVDIAFAAGYDVTGATNQNPSEYVSTTTAPVTKWFDYANPFTVDGNGVVTDSGMRTSVIPNAWYTPVTPLLSEPAASNIYLQSQAMATTPWAVNGSTPTNNSVVAPDGTTTATRIAEFAGITAHLIYQPITLTAVASTFSCYLKAGERTWAALNMDSLGYTYFDLQNGVVGTVAASTVATIKAMGNGWYRCTTTKTTAAGAVNSIVAVASADNTGSYSGDITKGIYAWGAQLETGSVATTYIPTATGTGTRAATSDSYPSAGNLPANDFTIYAEWSPKDTYASGYAHIFGTGTGAPNTLQMYYQSGSFTFVNLIASSALNRLSSRAEALSVGTVYKIAGKLSSTGGISIFVNGVKGATTGSATDNIVAGTVFIIGSAPTIVDANGVSNANIGAIRIYNTALSDAELTRMTS